MSNTRSGRLVKKVGYTDHKANALSNLAKLRKGEGRRTDQYDAEAGKLSKTLNHDLIIWREIFLIIYDEHLRIFDHFYQYQVLISHNLINNYLLCYKFSTHPLPNFLIL